MRVCREVGLLVVSEVWGNGLILLVRLLIVLGPVLGWARARRAGRAMVNAYAGWTERTR